MPIRPLAVSSGTVVALVLGFGAVTLLPGTGPVASAQGLVAYESCGQLLDHYRGELERSAQPWGFGAGGDIGFARQSGEAMPAAAGADMATGSSWLGGSSDADTSAPTGTNLQERGVDEPDLAKTSGDLLLAIAHNRLQVVRRGAEPELLSSTPLGIEAWGAELLVDGDRVLVLAPHGGMWGHPASSSRPAWGPTSGTTSALLYDLGDPRTPRLVEQLQLDGRYLSARLSDGAVRLVTASYPSPEAVQPAPPHGTAEVEEARERNRAAARELGLADVLPRLERRSADGRVLSEGQAVDCAAVRHAPSPRGASTLLVTTLDLDRGLEPRDSTAVTTDGDLVYASADRLYVATSRWGTTAPMPMDDTVSSSPSDTPTAEVDDDRVTTELHAFDTSSPDRTAYAGSGSVDGYVLGRWALSSHAGHLRVATTSAPPWGGGQPSSSSVIVMEEREKGLVQKGRVDGLGVGERIYAVRYFGDLATVVTFRQTDPLYVLDLADPAAPELLGELKIPGFSTYLHPVGDGLLLGLGKDADANGWVTGMQVSLFDLSDRSRPTQVDRLSLGQGHTQAGDDSRAFGWDAARRTALLPLQQYDNRGSWSGALGVRVEGRTLVEAGRMEVVAAATERVLSDGEHVYAVTALGVVAGDPDTFARTGAVDFGR